MGASFALVRVCLGSNSSGPRRLYSLWKRHPFKPVGQIEVVKFGPSSIEILLRPTVAQRVKCFRRGATENGRVVNEFDQFKHGVLLNEIRHAADRGDLDVIN